MELDRLLDAVLRNPDLADAIARIADELWGEVCAVLVVDMAGFTRTTDAAGIFHALVDIRRMQVVGRQIVEAMGGTLVKFDADNLFATFPDVPAALVAAADLTAVIPCSAGVGYGRVLLPPGDLYGTEVNRASKLGEDIATAGQVIPTGSAEARMAALAAAA